MRGEEKEGGKNRKQKRNKKCSGQIKESKRNRKPRHDKKKKTKTTKIYVNFSSRDPPPQRGTRVYQGSRQ